LDDPAFVAVDTTGTFAVRGTREDNHLEWRIEVAAEPQAVRP